MPEITYRYITPAELHFYSVLAMHYKQRSKALPDVAFLKRYAKTLNNIVQTKTIRTYA